MKVHTFLPLFSGFYNSIWDHNIYNEEEQIIEYYNEENGTDLKWSDFKWTYDFVGYSKAIAEGIIKAMNLIAIIRKDNKSVHSIYEDNGVFYSKGEYGDGKHYSIISVLQDLQGQDVHLDDIFWE